MSGKEITRPVLQTIKTNFDADRFIKEHGGVVLFSNNSEVRSTCVFHKGTNASTLSYSKSKGLFHCFGECGFSGDVFEAIKELEGLKFTDAVRRAAEYAGVDLSDSAKFAKGSDTGISEWEAASEAAYILDKDKNEVLFSPIISKAFDKRKRLLKEEYMTKHGFGIETIEAFGLGYCDFNDSFNGRMIIPIFDESGDPVGYSGRLLKPNGGSEQKYRIRKGFRKKFVLYNLNNAHAFIEKGWPIVITEGFGQTWRLLQAGIPSGVALMGSSITEQQKILIIKNTLSVILALDFDEDGLEATKEAIEDLKQYVDLKVVIHEDFYSTQDLADTEPEKVKAMVATAVSPEKWLEMYDTWIESHCNEKEVGS
jgi:DNA primase